MTFIEAAIEVLRREGRPLHHEKISELAIKYRLLSHVGKNPESIMLTRLSLQTRGTKQQGPLVRVKPGIFALAEWKGGSPGPRKQTPEEIAAEAAAEEAESNQTETRSRGEGRSEEAKEVRDNKREPRERRDDKREERRESKRDEAQGERREAREPRDDRREPREPRESREPREVREPREEQRREVREPREVREAREPREERSREPRRDNRRDLRAKRRSLVEVAEETLRGLSDTRPRSLKALIQSMTEHQVDASITAAAIVADNIRRRALGLVPTFSFDGSHVGLSEWASRKKSFELEQDLSRVSLEKNEELYKELAEKISSMRGGALEHWVTLALENAGFGGVRLMRRSSLGNFVVVARATQNLSNAKIVAMIRCSGAQISAKDVSDLRANTETYRAQSAIMISFTGFAESAINEAANQAPTVVLWDEKVVSRLLATQLTVNHQIVSALSL